MGGDFYMGGENLLYLHDKKKIYLADLFLVPIVFLPNFPGPIGQSVIKEVIMF